MRFINKESRELAEKLHKEEHLIMDKKIDKDHRLYDWYYLMASGIFQNLKDEIESKNVEIYNFLVDLSKEIKLLKESMKEVSKQQKYLWETLEDKNELNKVRKR